MAVFIIDNGSASLKAGFSDAAHPTFNVPMVVGRPKYQHELFDLPFDPRSVEKDKKQTRARQKTQATAQRTIIGAAALQSSSIYNLRYPIVASRVVDFEGLHDIYLQLFYAMAKVEPSDHPVMVSESLDTSDAQRLGFCETFFEELRVPEMAFVMQPVMSLCSTGLTSGFVIESGHGSTQMCGIADGYLLPNCCSKVNFWSGATLNGLIQDYLSRCRIFEADVERDWALITAIKHRFARLNAFSDRVGGGKAPQKISWNAMYKRQEDNPSLYEFPDGSVADLSAVSRITHAMFWQNESLGFEHENLSETIKRLIQKAEIDLRREIMGNIVLNGGGAAIPGLRMCLEADLKETLENSSAKVAFHVEEPPTPFPVWQGGGIMCEIDPGRQSSSWVTKEVFQEEGARALQKLRHL
jgi:actin-related protein